MEPGVQVAIITAISALVIALIKRRPTWAEAAKLNAETNGIRAQTDLVQQQILDSANGTIESLRQQLETERAKNDALRAERDDARARLARCKCGEGGHISSAS